MIGTGESKPGVAEEKEFGEIDALQNEIIRLRRVEMELQEELEALRSYIHNVANRVFAQEPVPQFLPEARGKE